MFTRWLSGAEYKWSCYSSIYACTSQVLCYLLLIFPILLIFSFTHLLFYSFSHSSFTLFTRLLIYSCTFSFYSFGCLRFCSFYPFTDFLISSFTLIPLLLYAFAHFTHLLILLIYSFYSFTHLLFYSFYSFSHFLIYSFAHFTHLQLLHMQLSMFIQTGFKRIGQNVFINSFPGFSK